MSLNIGSNIISPTQTDNIINNQSNKTVTPTKSQQIIALGVIDLINNISAYKRGSGTVSVDHNCDLSNLIIGQSYKLNLYLNYTQYSGGEVTPNYEGNLVWNNSFTIPLFSPTNNWLSSSIMITSTKIIVNYKNNVEQNLTINGEIIDESLDGMNQVTVEPIPSDYIIPEGTLTISAPGTIDARQYASVSIPGMTTPTWNTATIINNTGKINYSINLPRGFKSTSQSFSSSITLPSVTGASITPSTTAQTAVASYQWTLGSIIVDAIPNTTVAYKKVYDKTVNDEDLNIVLSEVSRIEQNQFYNCLNITTLSNSTIGYINSAGFSNCKNLTTINLPNLQTIGFYPFQNCTKITTISLPNLSSVANGLISNNSYISSIELPKLVYVQNHYFLYNCSNLTYLSLPLVSKFTGVCNLANLSNLTSITLPACLNIQGTQTFMNDFNLSLIDLPQVSLIGTATFQNCYNLVNLSVPKLSIINGPSTFSNCSQLSTISFPMLTKISGSCTFINCINLISLYFMSNSMVTLTYSDIFSNTPFINSALTGSYGSIYVPTSLLTTYQTNSIWSWWSSRIVGI